VNLQAIAAELESCFAQIVESCASRGFIVAQLPQQTSHPQRLRLQVDGGHQPWTLEVDCSWPRLTELPKVFLLNHHQHLAHVGYNSVVCINDGQGLSIDQARQADTVAETVLSALSLLEQSAKGLKQGNDEFYNELEGYWTGLPNVVAGRTYTEIDERDRFIVGYFDRASRWPTWYFIEHRGNIPPEFNVSKLAAMPALYFAMDKAIPPPMPGAELDTTYVNAVLARLTPPQQALWRRLSSSSAKTKSRLVALVLSIPRAAGGRSVVGMSFSIRSGKVEGHHGIAPIAMFRHSATYMRERGGALLSLESKHVVVIGCGSVGSEVADALATSGVGFLTLVDPEALSEDNVFRHVLGRHRITQAKVYGLKDELMAKYPGLQILPMAVDAHSWLAQSDLDNVDGIVFALGMPTLERELAKRLRTSNQDCPLVHTWLEPLDLGGHSVLVRSVGEGCLECVYRDDEGLPTLVPQTAFLAPGQKVSRTLTGCASFFVPYGAIQSRRTALLAAQQMLNALTKQYKPAYEFWSGAGDAAEDAGLATTHWWKRSKSTSPQAATAQVFGRPCHNCRGTS
jgi:hypothetical protein